MALLLPKSVFIHIPKTGGSWVRAAVKNAGIPTRELGCIWHEGLKADWILGPSGERLPHPHVCYHNTLRDIGIQERCTFSFIRHPVGFYRSYWAYKMQRGWDPSNGLDARIQSDSFNEFVHKCCKDASTNGFASRGYRHFLHDGNRSVDIVGRQECLADDLVRALRIAGETFDENALRATPPTNESSREWTSQAIVSPELLTYIYDHDREAYEEFGYERNPGYVPAVSVSA